MAFTSEISKKPLQFLKFRLYNINEARNHVQSLCKSFLRFSMTLKTNFEAHYTKGIEICACCSLTASSEECDSKQHEQYACEDL